MKEFSTDRINTLKFRPHGRVDIALLEEGIVIQRVYGPCNLELLNALDEIEQQVLAEFKATFGQWCEIIYFVDSCLTLNDAMDFHNKYLKKLAKEGLAALATAVVLEDGIEGKSIMSERYKQNWQYAGLLYKEFNNLNDAIFWTRTQISNV